MPREIDKLFAKSSLTGARLLMAIVERETTLKTDGKGPQSDVFALINTDAGLVSATIEAKVDENFGDELDVWREARGVKEKKAQARSRANRTKRWDQELSPCLPASSSYESVRYQLLQRTAAAVIEGRAFGADVAVMIVQAFGDAKGTQASADRFKEYQAFCKALAVNGERNKLIEVPKSKSQIGLRLFVGWAQCKLATDTDVIQTMCPT